jgi:hypothetical protein
MRERPLGGQEECGRLGLEMSTGEDKVASGLDNAARVDAVHDAIGER